MIIHTHETSTVALLIMEKTNFARIQNSIKNKAQVNAFVTIMSLNATSTT